MKTSLRIRRVLAALAMFFCVFTASAHHIFINEVLADNNSAFNNDGDFPDYVEIFNTNTVAVNISGWFLTTDVNKLADHNFTYVFPPNTTIAGRSFLVVICDGQTNQRLHTRYNI